jgi:hypothetical protein
MPRHIKVILTLAALALSVGATRAQAASVPAAREIKGDVALDCSDSGRSCSVDRNCCSGVCNHGSCQ